MQLLIWDKSRTVAMSWYAWLQKQGVPAALVKRADSSLYSVFRGGKVYQRERAEQKEACLIDAPAEENTCDVVIIDACNGYDWDARHGKRRRNDA